MPSIALVDVRPKLAAILAPVADDDAPVFDELLDAITPPVLLVVWGDPKLEEVTVCRGFALPVVTCIVGRMDVAPSLGDLDALTDSVVRRIGATPGGWSVRGITGPRVLDVGNLHYLAERVEVRVPVVF